MLLSVMLIFACVNSACCLLCCPKAHNSTSSSLLLSTLSSAHSYSSLEDASQNPLCLSPSIFTIQNNTIKIISPDIRNCKEVYDSRWNKTGVFESNQLFVANVRWTSINNNLPAQITGRVECIYEFYASTEERVQIKFLDFNLPSENKNSSECKPNDSLQLLTQVKGKYEAVDFYCGAFLPKPVMSKGPKLVLQFVGKYPNNQQKVGYYGFKAEYKFVTNYGITTGYQLGHNCTFVYNSTIKKNGFFTSPNFPGLYPQNIVCHFLFYGEFEEKVKIHFSFFDVEGIDSCGYLTASDYVEFSNFLSTDRKFAKYCGKRDKFEIRSDDRFFRVSFYSNDRFDRNGFRAYYQFEGKSTPSENTSMQSYTSDSSEASSIGLFINLLIMFCFIGLNTFYKIYVN